MKLNLQDNKNIFLHNLHLILYINYTIFKLLNYTVLKVYLIQKIVYLNNATGSLIFLFEDNAQPMISFVVVN